GPGTRSNRTGRTRGRSSTRPRTCSASRSTSSRTMALAGTRARVGDWTGGDEPVRAQPGGLVTAGEVHPQLGSALLSVAAQLRLGLLRDRADRGLDVQARL